jgi:hypothetical protein
MKTKIISEKQRRETPKQQRQLTKQSQWGQITLCRIFFNFITADVGGDEVGRGW